jgi:hypothetical protein
MAVTGSQTRPGDFATFQVWDNQLLSGAGLQSALGRLVVPWYFRMIVFNLKHLADQGNAEGQCWSGVCLRDGLGISKDLKGAEYYLKLSADQRNAER